MPERIDERTPGRRLWDRIKGSEVSDGSRYFVSANPAVKAAFERVGREIEDEVGRLTRDRDDAIRSRDTHKAWNHTAERERDAANVKVERLREALAFYADPATHHSRRAQNAAPITLDSGQRARAALDAARQPEGDGA